MIECPITMVGYWDHFHVPYYIINCTYHHQLEYFTLAFLDNREIPSALLTFRGFPGGFTQRNYSLDIVWFENGFLFVAPICSHLK